MWNIGPQFWWISQVQTFQVSNAGGYLWAPVADRRGHPHWARLRELKPGDITAHYSRGGVKAVGRVRSQPYDASCPEELKPLIPYLADLPGRRVDVEYHPLSPLIPIADILPRLRDLDLENGPLDKNGRPKQNYVLRFSREGLRRLQELYKGDWPEWAAGII